MDGRESTAGRANSLKTFKTIIKRGFTGESFTLHLTSFANHRDTTCPLVCTAGFLNIAAPTCKESFNDKWHAAVTRQQMPLLPYYLKQVSP